MLALLFMTKVTGAVATAAAGANDTQAVRPARANQPSIGDQLLEMARGKSMSVLARDALVKDAGHSDAAFIEREIKSHLEAIALYEDEAGSSDPQLRAFAKRILPQLQRHLTHLRSQAGK